MTNLSVSTLAAGEDEAVQAVRLRQVLVWLAAICFVSAPIELGLGLFLSSPILQVIGSVGVSIGVITLLALAFVRRGQARTAVMMMAGAMLITIVGLSLALPTMVTAMTIAPLLVITLLLPYLTSRQMLVCSVVAFFAMVAIVCIDGLIPPLLSPPSMAVALTIDGVTIAAISSLTLLLLWQFSSQLLATIAQTRKANDALEHARATLESQVAARTADLRVALADVQARAQAQAHLLDENNQQRTTIRNMSVPILPVSAKAIVIPLIGDLDSARLQLMQEQTLQAIEHQVTRYVLLDITGVPVVDTHVAQGLLRVVQSVRLLGAEAVLVGVSPEVAQTVVSLGLDLRDIPTRQSLQDGIAYTVSRDRHQKVMS